MTMKCRELLLLATVVCMGEGLPKPSPQGFNTARHVLIIGCDGLGGVYLENATSFLPNLAKFFTHGSYTTRGRGQFPLISAPNWAAVLTSLGPEESGIIANEQSLEDTINNTLLDLPAPVSGSGKIPETMWRVAKSQNDKLVTASVETWDWIHYLVEPGIVDYEYRARWLADDQVSCNNLCSIIESYKPNLMFVHFDSIDDAGHSSYWGSDTYYSAIKNVDGYIKMIFESLEKAGILQDTLIIATADHGGYYNDHGPFDSANVYIPALFIGPHIKRGHTISSYISNKDFAPTALNALGLQPGKHMVGRIVEEIYE